MQFAANSVERRAYGVDLESAVVACFGEGLSSAAEVVELQPFEQQCARGPMSAA